MRAGGVMAVEMRGEASAYIAAPPAKVYELISDITRIGEWSPECVGATWADGSSGPEVGAVFSGTNRRATNEWTTPNTVIAAKEGEEFAWVVGTADFRVCTWRYHLAAEREGTRITESFELGKENVGFTQTVMDSPAEERSALVEARRSQLVADMEQTLARLKGVAETTASTV